MKTKKVGTVYLVGAGPGDPGLITVRGLELLRGAEVLVYDYLANPVFLREVKPGCEKIYAGKSYQGHTKSQKEIHEILIELTRAGKNVVRLKGGDPFIFGRGGEECEELARAGVPFEVVPAVSSACGGPAYAGIPVTHRDHNSVVSFITGHEDPTKENSHIDWSKLAHNEATLVFLMGVGQLSEIAKKLIKNGMEASIPVAVISWGTWPKQKTFTGTLENIAKVVQENQVKPPAIIVVGKVVSLRDKIAWFENRPLFGKRIVVTRARRQASDLARLLSEKGAEVIEFPTIRIEPLKSYKEIDAEIEKLSGYDWLIFTSVNGVDYFFQRLRAVRKDVRSLAAVKIAAIGPATQNALESKGLLVDLLPKEFVAESVVKAFKEKADLNGKRILIPRAKEARDLLEKELEKEGAEVKAVPVYETVVDREGKKEILESFKVFPPDVVTFTSSSTVKNFVDLTGEDSLQTLFKKTRFASIGPITSKTAEQLQVPVSAQAETYTIPGLIESVEKLVFNHAE